MPAVEKPLWKTFDMPARIRLESGEVDRHELRFFKNRVTTMAYWLHCSCLNAQLTSRRAPIAAQSLAFTSLAATIAFAALLFAAAAQADEVPPDALLFGFEE